MKTKRSYTMGARALAVEDTRTRILEALFTLGLSRVFPEISLEDVAREAGVSVQTVLRHFGSRTALIESTMDYAIQRITSERLAPTGDAEAALTILVDHYELRGDTTMMMLAQESSDPLVHRLTDRGRQLHRDWVRTTYRPVVTDREDLVDLLVVATDVYTWKLLRRDRGHSRDRTEQQMRTLVHAITSQTEGAH